MAAPPADTSLLRIGDLKVDVVEVKGFESRTFTEGSTGLGSAQAASGSGSSSAGLPSAWLGLFCSVLFEGEEQKTPAVLDSKWNHPLEFGVDGTEQDEGLVVVVKERKETGKKGVLREDELGRVVVPLADLELMHARDHWYPLVTKGKGTNAAIRLVITYTFSRVDDLINIFSEPAQQSNAQQKLSLSSLQYNIMRVILAMMPLFRIIKQLIDLFKWERPAASMLALLVFVFCCLFDLVASLAFALGSAHFVSQYLQHYRQRRLDQDMEVEDELSKDAWNDYRFQKKKDKGKEKDRNANKAKEKKASIFTKMRRVQIISGKIADKIEPIRALWDWKDPKKSMAVMYVLVLATVLFLFVSFWLCLRYALLCLGVYLFTLAPLYNKFPRFKRRYHHSILIKRLKNQIIPHTLAFLLVKLRLRNSISTKKKHLTLEQLGKGCVQAGYLVKLASVGNIWKRRYFVLKDQQLLYFNSSSPQEKLVAWIELGSCGIINLENNLVKNRPYSFDIFDSNIPRHYLLAANDEKEKEEWVASFSMVLNRQPVLEASTSTSTSTSSSHQRGLSADVQPQSIDFLLSGAASSASSTVAVSIGSKRQSISVSTGVGPRAARPRSRSDIPSPASNENESEADPSKQLKVTLGGLSETTRSGWLQKRGKNRKAWKTRYFVLTGINLFYFKKANAESVPAGAIQLDGAKIFSIQGPKKGHQFCMGLYARTRYYLLSTRDEQDRGAWLAAIKNVSGVPITSVDVTDDSDPESDEAQPPAVTPASWVPAQLLERGARTSIPLAAAGTRRSRRTTSLQARGTVSKRSMASSDQTITFHDEKAPSHSILVSDLSDNAKEGYLLRQEGKMRKTWRSRFVVLASDVLYIFGSSQPEEKVVESIQLSNCSIYAVTGAIKGREHCIDIYRAQPSKHYLFAADDEKDRHAWINAIKHARGDKVVGETPEQELIRKEKEIVSKLTATLNWMHQLIREGKVREVIKLLQDADKETTGVEREEDISSRDLVQAREPQDGQTLLHVAAEHGRLSLVKELVEVYKADINKADKKSWSPLHTAANHSQIDVFEYLVDRGASLYATTSNGSSPLHYLVRFTRSPLLSGGATNVKGASEEEVESRLLEVVQKTIEMGGDINVVNRGGDTPLHLAAGRPYFRLIKLLLENKANISIRNVRGESAVDLAVKEGHEEIVALMQAYELVANDPAFARELNSPPPSHPARSQQRAMSLTEELKTTNADLKTTGILDGAEEEIRDTQPAANGDAIAANGRQRPAPVSVRPDELQATSATASQQEEESESEGTRESTCDGEDDEDKEIVGDSEEEESEDDASSKQMGVSEGTPAVASPRAAGGPPEVPETGQRVDVDIIPTEQDTTRPDEEKEKKEEKNEENVSTETSDGSETSGGQRGLSSGSSIRASSVIGGRATSHLDVRALMLQSNGGAELSADRVVGDNRQPQDQSRGAAPRSQPLNKPLPLPPPPASPIKREEGAVPVLPATPTEHRTPERKSVPKPLPAPPSPSASTLDATASASGEYNRQQQQVRVTLSELSANRTNLQTGSLKLLSRVRKVWKRYHVVLADYTLYLYDSNTGSERVSKLVDVRKCDVLETLETKKERWCFDVYNNESKDHWVLATETEVEKKQWLEALRKVQGQPVAQWPQ